MGLAIKGLIMVLRKFYIYFILIFFVSVQSSFAFAQEQNIYLNKEEETVYNIIENDCAENSFLITRYKIVNNTKNKYEIIKETKINNSMDKKVLKSIRRNIYSENTVFTSLVSIMCPIIIPVAVVELTYDTLKMPYTIYKNKSYQKKSEEYTKSLIGKRISPQKAYEFYTLQSAKDKPINFEVTLKDLKSQQTINLIANNTNFSHQTKYEKIENSHSHNNSKKTGIYSSNSGRIDYYYSYNIAPLSSAIMLDDKRAVITGGIPNSEIKGDEVFLLDIPNTNLNIKEKTKLRLLRTRILHNLIPINKNKILVYGGKYYFGTDTNHNRTTEIIDLENNTVKQGPSTKAKLDNKNSFAVILPDNNILIGKLNNDFVEIYNPKTNSIEVKENIKTGEAYLYDDENYIYFANYNHLSKLNKKTLKYEIYSQNNIYEKVKILSAVKLNNNKIILAQKDKNGISIYEYDEQAKEKIYYARNIGSEITFFKYIPSDNCYFLTKDKSIYYIYKIIPEENHAIKVIMSKAYLWGAEILPLPNFTLILGAEDAVFTEYPNNK